RVGDAILSKVRGGPQVWAEGQWHEKFGMPATAMGIGDTLEQVATFKPALADLQGYAEAVRQKSLAVLKGLSPADLEREVPVPGGGTRKVGDYLGILMTDPRHHSGQIAYLRGYLTGKGWFPR